MENSCPKCGRKTSLSVCPECGARLTGQETKEKFAIAEKTLEQFLNEPAFPQAEIEYYQEELPPHSTLYEEDEEDSILSEEKPELPEWLITRRFPKQYVQKRDSLKKSGFPVGFLSVLKWAFLLLSVAALYYIFADGRMYYQKILEAESTAMLVYCVAGAVGTMFSYLLVFFVTYGFWRLKEAGYYGWLVRILARSILLSLTLNWASGNDANHMAFLISLLFVVQAPFDLLVLWYLEKRRFIFSQKGELPEVTILSGGSLRVKATQGMRKRFCLYSVAYLASFIISLVIVYAAGAVITA